MQTNTAETKFHARSERRKEKCYTEKKLSCMQTSREKEFLAHGRVLPIPNHQPTPLERQMCTPYA